MEHAGLSAQQQNGMKSTRAAIAYCLLIATWFIANRLLHDQNWLSILANHIAFLYFLPLWVLVPITLFTRRWLTCLLFLIPLAIFFYFHSAQLKPSALPGTQTADLRIATYNILGSNRDVDGIVTNITRIDADLIALQEFKQSNHEPILDAVAPIYPFQHVNPNEDGIPVVLLSKYPFDSLTFLDLQARRPAIIATVTIEGQQIGVVSAHLNPIFFAYHNRLIQDIPAAVEQYGREKHRQVAILEDALSDYDNLPLFLACDCNTRSTARARWMLDAFLDDSADVLGWPLRSSPFEWAEFERRVGRIDYVWYRGQVRPIGVYVVKDAGGSDHRPVFADFVLAR